MVVNNEIELAVQVEQANFIMLSLYREYSKRLLKNKYNVYYEKQMQLIKHDLMYLDKQQMVTKAQQIYVPLLKEMMNKQ
ncbi:MAG: hypothetical protein IJW72_00915 [Alphaproteobacteria bacterium]|nr:hypothetical protein [Alphaproteobacteria bacterium]MBQ7284801.1 hypothetical protein [Alphaproteobacteria bacterium]